MSLVIIAAIAACILVAAFCAATEHALAEASRAKIDDMLEEPKRDRTDRRLARYDELLLSAVIYRTGVEIAAVIMLARSEPLRSANPYVVWGWAVAMVLVLAEIIPRMLAIRAPESTVLSLLPTFHAITLPLLPLTSGLMTLARFVRKTTREVDEDEDEAAEDILSAVTEGEKEGAIAGEQADMIENIIELRDVDVAEIMTPRPDMISVRIDAPFEKTIETVLASGRSRLPVFRETRDDIVGILNVRDLIAALAPGHTQQAPLSTEQLMRPPHFVPETMRISDLLRHFQDNATTIAIVVDEYGGTAGLVTISDLVHVIVGEVRDQHEPQMEPDITVLDPHTLEADARAAVRRLNEDFGTHLPESDEYDTVAGYLCYTMGRVPRRGDQHAFADGEIVVVKADERRVQTVKITLRNGVKTD